MIASYVRPTSFGSIGRVRHVPDLRARPLLRVHPLVDRVLVRARERRVHELADVRMAWMNGKLVALLDDRPRLVDRREVELRVDALREQVERERDEVDVAGPLAVAEERALHTLGAGHEPELGRGDGRAAVVVRVHGEDRRVALREVTPEPLDPIRVDVRRELLDGRRQVDDHLLLGRRPPLLGDRLADLVGVVELRVVEALGRVLEHDLGVRGRRQLPAEPCAPDGELCDAGTVETEDDASLGDRRRVVEMHDRALRAGDGLERACDELGPRLRQHGDRRPARNEILLDQEPHEVEVRPGGRRESDLDLGDSEREQQRKEPLLARAVHRIDERLVAVPEVRRAPDRRRVDDTVGPRSIGKIDSCVRTVLPVRHGHLQRSSGSMRSLDGGRTKGANGTDMSARRFPYRGRKSARQASRRRVEGAAWPGLVTRPR